MGFSLRGFVKTGLGIASGMMEGQMAGELARQQQEEHATQNALHFQQMGMQQEEAGLDREAEHLRRPGP